ncbi:MAG: hypothetical protein PHU71_05490 [Candidatus Gracilibacteria bacterium]|nr:hypothetical protein [Candidatus Gracilibacteria bacterium]
MGSGDLINASNLLTTILPSWLTAIGTIGATVVALWLALKAGKLRYYAEASLVDMVDIHTKNNEGFFKVDIFNKSANPIRIEGLVWKVSKALSRSRNFVMLPDFNNPISDNPPKLIKIGEKASFLIKEIDFKKGTSLLPEGKVSLYFYTSDSRTYKIRFAKSLRDYFENHKKIKRKN